MDRMDKSIQCCLTCQFWGGYRIFDGLGSFSYDMYNKDGRCNQVGWKGFSGATMDGMQPACADYSPLVR